MILDLPFPPLSLVEIVSDYRDSDMSLLVDTYGAILDKPTPRYHSTKPLCQQFYQRCKNNDDNTSSSSLTSTQSQSLERQQEEQQEHRIDPLTNVNDDLPTTTNESIILPSPDDNDTIATASSSRQSQPQQHRRTVSFSHLEIREHSLIVGDHPSCSTGLPLSLGWKHALGPSRIIPLDDYEESRGARKHGSLMRLSPMERKYLLKRVGGMSEKDLVQAERRHKVIRQQIQCTSR